MNKKTILHTRNLVLTVAAFSALSLQSVSGQITLAEDNFDSYSIGSLSDGAFPSASPGGGTWQAATTGGSLDIVAAPGGGSGNVFQVTDTQTGALQSFPTIGLTIPTYTGAGLWELNVDFRVETPPSTNFAGPGLLRLEGDAGELGRISFFRNDSTPDLTVFSNAWGSGNSNLAGILANETWHTLTLIGDNTAGTVTASVNGGSASILTYNTASTGINLIELGDPDSLENNTVVLYDNFSLTAVPEPASYGTIFAVVSFALVCLRRRRLA